MNHGTEEGAIESLDSRLVGLDIDSDLARWATCSYISISKRLLSHSDALVIWIVLIVCLTICLGDCLCGEGMRFYVDKLKQFVDYICGFHTALFDVP